MRQVNGWGFKRIVSGNDHNSYYHELFVRELPQLCLKMKRIKKGEADKAKKDDDSEDNQSIENGKDDRSKGNDSGQRQNEEQGSDESGNGNKQNQVQNQQQPSFNMGPNTNLAYQGLQNVGALSQTLNPTGGNDVALNFLKASGFPLQGLMGNQAPNMGAVNGQNFLQGLINAGGASNNLQGFNFGHPGAAFANNGIAPQGGTPLNIQTMPNQATNGMQNSTTNETQSQISSGEQAAAQNGPVDQGGNNGGIGGNVFAGIDSATLAKLQEALAAAGGGNNFLQSQQQANANSSLPNTNTNGSNNANAFASLLNNQLGGQNASLLASQLQAASQPAQQNSSEESELKTDQ